MWATQRGTSGTIADQQYLHDIRQRDDSRAQWNFSLSPVTCLAGDPGNHSPFGDDSLCQPGFQSFPGGMNQFAQYPGYGQIQQQEMATNASYNGLQTGVRVQNRRGLSGEVDYTWWHEIDIQSDDNNCCVSNPWNLKYDKGSGGLDRRHILSIDYVYQLPFLARAAGRFTLSAADGRSPGLQSLKRAWSRS